MSKKIGKNFFSFHLYPRTSEGQNVLEENSKHVNIYNNEIYFTSLKRCFQCLLSHCSFPVRNVDSRERIVSTILGKRAKPALLHTPKITELRDSETLARTSWFLLG
jgi:hypothetical protein